MYNCVYKKYSNTLETRLKPRINDFEFMFELEVELRFYKIFEHFRNHVGIKNE